MIQNTDIDHGAGFDWGNASEEYSRFRDIYPDAFYKKIFSLGLCTEGQRVQRLTSQAVEKSDFGSIFSSLRI